MTTPESDFALATFERAIAARCRLVPLNASAGPGTRQRDEALAEAFMGHFTTFRRVLNASRLDSKALRASALGAYAAVRARHELRQPPSDVAALDLLPFDEEDRRLAGV